MPNRRKTWVNRHVHEHYYRRAKSEGFRARSAYKLWQIIAKYPILEIHGEFPRTILDLGCAPGSWIEVIIKRYNENKTTIKQPPRILGIDLTTIRPFEGEIVEFYRCDVFKPACEDKIIEWAPEGIDLILSDLAPKTSGNDRDLAIQEGMVDRVLELTSKFLHTHGNIVVKMFQSENSLVTVKKWANQFKTLNLCKPKASTPGSRETFLIGIDFQKI
jgi:23S rRNA U2552 (ribose-2'-O)-methylase RlmE/FtsJ